MKVTLEFHDSRKERPQKSGEYIVMNKGFSSPGVICTHYSKGYDMFNAYDGDYAGGNKYGRDYEYWAEIPAEFLKAEGDHV